MLIQQRLKRLQEERGRVNKDMESMVETAEKENKRSLTAEEEKRFDDLSNDFSAKTAEIERLQKLAKAESQRNEEHNEEVEQRNVEKTAEQKKTEYRSAFLHYLAYGAQDLSVEQRSILKEGYVDQRALGSGKSGGQTGGYTIPTTLSSELEKALKTVSGMIDVSRYINTASGEPFGWPTTNDTANKARIIGENTSSITGSTDPTFGQVGIGAHLYTSDFILIPLTLIQDSILNIDSVVAELLAERFGRAFNAHFTTGSGNNQPMGLITALNATDGSSESAKRTIAGAAAAITFDNLIDIQHGPDRAYRNNAQYMFSDDTLKSLRKIKSTDGHYIFQLGNPQTGTPDTIMGKRFTINDDMANVGAGNISAVFGDFNKYIIRQVLTPVIKRTEERFIESFQLGIVGFARMDGNLTQPLAFSALKHAAA